MIKNILSVIFISFCISGCVTTQQNTQFHSTGIASYYWQGQKTASGEKFNPNGLTAAHKSLKIGTRVKVVNKSNGKSVIVRINDRGPYVNGRVIDLSKKAAQELEFVNSGLTNVELHLIN